jgi:hypothetical protein
MCFILVHGSKFSFLFLLNSLISCVNNNFMQYFLVLDQCIRSFGLYNTRCRYESKRSTKESSCKGHKLLYLHIFAYATGINFSLF